MNIIILNLDRATDRKEAMLEQLKKANIDESEVLFYSGFDGKKIRNTSINPKIQIGWGVDRKINNGELACLLSHIEAVKIAKILKYESVIILEDDVVLCEDFKERFEYLMKIIPKNWEHLFLGGHVYEYEPFSTPALLPSSFKISGAYSYAIHNIAYDKVIENLSSLLTVTDDLFEYMIFNKSLKSFIYFPHFTYPLQGFSYIHEEKGAHKVHPSFKYFKEKYK